MLKKFRKATFIQKGEEIYEDLRSKIEKKHKGEVMAIDPETRKFVIGKDTLEAALKAKKIFPDKIFYFIKIGYPAVHKLR